MPDVKAVLEERNGTHGDFQEQFVVAQQIKSVFEGVGYGKCTPVQRETLDLIAHKISRVLTGNPNFKEHWVDIAGYATLIAERT